MERTFRGKNISEYTFSKVCSMMPLIETIHCTGDFQRLEMPKGSFAESPLYMHVYKDLPRCLPCQDLPSPLPSPLPPPLPLLPPSPKVSCPSSVLPLPLSSMALPFLAELPPSVALGTVRSTNATGASRGVMPESRDLRAWTLTSPGICTDTKRICVCTKRACLYTMRVYSTHQGYDRQLNFENVWQAARPTSFSANSPTLLCTCALSLSP